MADFSVKMDELMNNEEFCKKLEVCQTKEETIALFQTEGVNVEDELFGLIAVNLESIEVNSELSEDELDDVDGGISWKLVSGAWSVGKAVGKSTRKIYDYYKYGDVNKTYKKWY